MKVRSIILICLLCLVAFSIASPGKDRNLRNARREQRQREREQAEREKQAEQKKQAEQAAQEQRHLFSSDAFEGTGRRQGQRQGQRPRQGKSNPTPPGMPEQPVQEQRGPIPPDMFDQAAQELRRQMTSGPGEYKLEATPIRGKATMALITGVLARYNWRTNLQEYFIVVTEGRADKVVRISTCRIATKGAISDDYLYSPKYGCRDVSNLMLPSNPSFYDIMLLYSDGVFKEGKGETNVDMSRVHFNYNLAIRMKRRSHRDLSLWFRFARGKRFDNDANPMVVGRNDWECPVSNDNYEDCIWQPLRGGMDLSSVMITPYEWHELPR